MVVILIMPLSACLVGDRVAVEDTVVGFFSAFEQSEYSRCLDFISQRQRNDKGDQYWISEFQSQRFWDGKATLRSMGEAQIGGRTATIRVDVEGLSGIVNSVQVHLVKEKDHWMISRFGS
jgi:hypothetical protein